MAEAATQRVIRMIATVTLASLFLVAFVTIPSKPPPPCSAADNVIPTTGTQPTDSSSFEPDLTGSTTPSALPIETFELTPLEISSKSIGLDFQVCDNAITRGMDHNVLLSALKERYMWGTTSTWALRRMDDTQTKNMRDNAPIDRSPNPFMKYAVRGWWSNWNHDWKRYDMMGPVVGKCKDLRHLGQGDEEKRLCFSDELVKPGCMVYSVGSNNQWSYEVLMARETPCEIHTFDCTVANPQPPDSIKDRVTFHKLCMGEKTFTSHGQKYTDLEGLVKAAGGKRATFFKMDIEGFEWETLPQIVASSNAWLKSTGEDISPLQIAIEMHYISWVHTHWWGRDRSPGEILALFNHLFFAGGYVLTDRRDNVECLHCSEILLTKLGCSAV